ncbi:MAG: aminodeoxychorismate/anthranilate synthase component II [Candidatus Coatesbacteria bacterium]
MILMIDNYDSFTYNLVQYLGEMGEDLVVFRNDKITISRIERLKPACLVMSPGPGRPEDAGIMCAAIRHFTGKIPILGVCLGHQAIGHVFGGKVRQAARLMHGKTSPIYHDGETLFRKMPNPFEAARYHSLLVERRGLPSCLKVSAWTEEGEIMGLRHVDQPVEGVQFHPESIMTQDGKALLRNFLAGAKAWRAKRRSA